MNTASIKALVEVQYSKKYISNSFSSRGNIIKSYANGAVNPCYGLGIYLSNGYIVQIIFL